MRWGRGAEERCEDRYGSGEEGIRGKGRKGKSIVG